VRSITRISFVCWTSFGYPGWIGCEYRPANGTAAGLGWMAPYLNAPQ
jgi:hydroxypyruvate isomerase